ncbi:MULTISPECIES: 30S ribosomal protein S1 [Brochothrix]|uniref:30S ribosomal protein S1 n=1 Tax=Brochothrix thermosphacta TaxID=2756 RepID=A0A1D2LUN4_BROTH|nr:MULTISPECIES: 30S ribosomal protein S1 [Brochothrix]ANZ94475.1 30S ribosomal protein S1 [Brochothrix thermosphacta]ATF26655.1 30S ribosomal protein S1 [Brochothrix thermosphacta]ATH86010.1 30S ribosomal protein S1 [Brochothrix thermosphacta]MBR5525834.1 30S ribosomal protein S1 [Brochothrix sp.]MPQ29189.1 30S ribosomal protein S1 [Brochothrix thermosphacta]
MTEEMFSFEIAELKKGDTVVATVSSVEDKKVYVSIPNAKQDGLLPASELSVEPVEDAHTLVKVGDELTLVVTRVEDDLIVLSKTKAAEGEVWTDLKEKFENGTIFDATITEVVKGGLVANVGIRAFIPGSLVTDHFVEDFSAYKGETLAVKIVEFVQEKGRVVLSHRAIVEAEKAVKQAELFATINEGDVVEGTVARLTNFGAFVTVNGVDGLVHISQLANKRVSNPSEVVAVGDEVKVKVLSVDTEKNRLALSIKATLPQPWDNISEQVAPDDVLEGTVARLTTFGAFINILPGVDGLVHISEIAHERIGTPQEVLSEGQAVTVKVLSVDTAERRIGLSIKALSDAPVTEEKAKSTATKEVVESYKMPEEETGFSLGDLLGADKLKEMDLKD